MDDETRAPRFPTVSGRLVVLCMIGFGILLTGAIWGYAKLELAPFVPLRNALDAEFPDSHPNVKGGRPKGLPPVLRVVMQVDFPPSETDDRITKIVERVMALAKEHVDLGEYESVEIYFERRIPEKATERLKIERKISEL
ncbi:MAG TPA: hypothetical protein VKU82_03210 [Planctomycetaceae bacterium]|nr:hypothetical protein [Planctomycetaceae bacterium]